MSVKNVYIYNESVKDNKYDLSYIVKSFAPISVIWGRENSTVTNESTLSHFKIFKRSWFTMNPDVLADLQNLDMLFWSWWSAFLTMITTSHLVLNLHSAEEHISCLKKTFKMLFTLAKHQILRHFYGSIYLHCPPPLNFWDGIRCSV